MKRALVTGATGHIGANLIRDLLDHGWAVTALVRPTSDLRGLEGTPAALAQGDVLDGASVAAAMVGCTHVFHAGAPYVTWARDPESIVRPAVLGTENVLRAAKRLGVERVVVTSSCNAVGFTRGAPLDERTWNDRAASPYIKAKNEQERRALALADELDLDVVTVLPTAVLGPYDYRKTPTTAPFVDVLAGRAPVPFATNVVDVRDVARGHVLAMERGRRRERYLLGGENVDVPTMAAIVGKLTGRRPAEGLPPLWVLRSVAAVAETVASITGKAPPITRAVLDDVDGGAPLFDCRKATTELGLVARGAEETLAATFTWASKMGWLPAKLASRAETHATT
ncbi:NAD-dependent epimerase/dehydratase family protein [Myxococcota bacterium]|nr:NAD-dependent epimerase/dehydratase family protein [Myxococcota bacterium]